MLFNVCICSFLWVGIDIWYPILIQVNRWPVNHPNQWYWSPVSFCRRICVCWYFSSLWSLLFAGCLIWLQYVWEFSAPLDLKTWDQSASEKPNLLITSRQGGWLVIFRRLPVNAPVSHCFIYGWRSGELSWVQEPYWGCSRIPTSVSSGKTQSMEGSNNHNEGLTYATSTPVGPDQPQSPGPSLIRDLEDGMARVETKKLKILFSDECIPSLSTTLLTRIFYFSPHKWYNASSKMSGADSLVCSPII